MKGVSCTLRRFCFGEPDFFVIPPECLSPDGLEPHFADALERHRRLPLGWTELFSSAFRLYWQRTAELAQRAPDEFLPPRALHCCIAQDPAHTRPYFQPIHNASWLFYQSDFDPNTSDPEFGAYLFLHLERMGWTREVLAAFTQNFGYFLLRSPEEIARFTAAAARCQRPDAAAFRALAEVVGWVTQFSHPQLRPRAVVLPQGEFVLSPTALRLPRSRKAEWQRITALWERTAREAVDRYLSAFQPPRKRTGRDLIEWLVARRPQLVLCVQRKVLWKPEDSTVAPELRSLLGSLHPEVATSLRADWETIDERSRRVWQDLPRFSPARVAVASIDPGGLCWLHPEHGRIAYDLLEPGMLRLKTPAPPLERWMLAARTVHEWGHWLAECGAVAVPEARRAEYETASHQLAVLCQEIVDESPVAVRSTLRDELERLAADGGTPGHGLARVAFARLGDYQANLVARRFLEPEEMETYVRNNVTCLRLTMRARALFQRLVRYAYEFQYLSLLDGLDDPWGYFLRVTGFHHEFWESGVISEQRTRALFELVGLICSLHEFEPSRLA